MTLIINNNEVAKVLTMEATIEILEESYKNLATGEAVCRPRIDIRIPTSDPAKNYQWGTMEGGSTGGYFAIRMKSDIIYEQSYNGVLTQEKYCTRPGLFCGLILLTSVETAEPLAFINDGVLQHMRVAADGGIGVKYMANQDAEVVGMLGSGGMARAHMQAFMHVRNIKKLQIFSPTKENREAFGREMGRKYNIEVQVCDRPEAVYKGAHILAGLTDSAVPVLDGSYLEKGTHIVNIGGSVIATPRARTRCLPSPYEFRSQTYFKVSRKGEPRPIRSRGPNAAIFRARNFMRSQARSMNLRCGQVLDTRYRRVCSSRTLGIETGRSVFIISRIALGGLISLDAGCDLHGMVVGSARRLRRRGRDRQSQRRTQRCNVFHDDIFPSQRG
jgi:ornithine cyclodeaminase/alanine dehydrogenase-like protein (mu-crystallin family)